MEIKYKIWIEKNGKVVFGKGRDNIFKAIDEQHSLNVAAIEKLFMKIKSLKSVMHAEFLMATKGQYLA